MAPGVIESLVLGTVHMWHSRHNKKEIVELVLQHFVADEVYKAIVELSEAAELGEPKRHNNSATRTAGEAYAPELYDMVDKLSKSGNLPKIVVPSIQLAQVPLATLRPNDEIAVGARLDSLEKSVKLLTETLKGGVPPANSFAGARARLNSASRPPVGLPEIRVTSPTAQPSYAAVASGHAGHSVGGGDHGGAASGGVQTGPGLALPARERAMSQGEKRKHESDETQQGNQRRQRKIAYGSSKVTIEENGEAAPLDYYVGNTNPKATESIIEKVLIKCAAGLEGSPVLKVLGVQLLTKGDNPRTKCWKITVPFKFKEIMEKDELYHAGWTHRKFYNPKFSPKNDSKHPRMDDPIEKMALEQAQAEQEQVGGALGAAPDQQQEGKAVGPHGEPEHQV